MTAVPVWRGVPWRTMPRLARAAAVAVLLFAIPAPVLAQDDEDPTPAETEAADEAGSELAIFLGMNDPNGSEEPDISFGLEYEYRLNRWFGLGLFGDYTDDTAEMVAGVPLYLHLRPAGGLKFFVAPAYRFVDDKEELGEEEGDSFVTRLGIAYTFEVSEVVAIAPIFQIDFIDDAEPDTAFVYGANLVLKLGVD